MNSSASFRQDTATDRCFICIVFVFVFSFIYLCSCVYNNIQLSTYRFSDVYAAYVNICVGLTFLNMTMYKIQWRSLHIEVDLVSIHTGVFVVSGNQQLTHAYQIRLCLFSVQHNFFYVSSAISNLETCLRCGFVSAISYTHARRGASAHTFMRADNTPQLLPIDCIKIMINFHKKTNRAKKARERMAFRCGPSGFGFCDLYVFCLGGLDTDQSIVCIYYLNGVQL